MNEVLDLPIDRIEWFLERLEERRDAEAAAIRKGNK